MGIEPLGVHWAMGCGSLQQSHKPWASFAHSDPGPSGRDPLSGLGLEGQNTAFLPGCAHLDHNKGLYEIQALSARGVHCPSEWKA